MSSDECYSDEDFEDDFEDLTEVSPSKEPLEESSDSVPICSSTGPACPGQPADEISSEGTTTSGASGQLSSSSFIMASSVLLLMVAAFA